MRHHTPLLTLILAGLAATGARAHSQANVTEGPATTIYVDSEKGSDSNQAMSAAGTPLAGTSLTGGSLAGASLAPLQTLQAAINVAKTNSLNKVATRIVVNPGTYRESMNIVGNSDPTAAPLTIEAATTGAVTVSGSDVLKGWQREAAHPTIYEHSWQYNFGTCALPTGWPTGFSSISRRTEMIFVNHKSLTQVLSFASLHAGTFFVNETGNLMHIYPPAGTNMSTALVEIAVRPQILSVNGRSNVVLRGLILQHARSCMNHSGAVVTGSTNVLIDHVQAVWNNWGGILISSSKNVTMQYSTASYNGGVGILGDRIVGGVFNSNKSNYNNWRGAQAGFYNWGMGGTKLMLSRNITVENHHSYGNHAQGLWFDTDNKNITITNASLSNNYLSSLQLEANEGPIVLKNSHLCNSGMGVTVLNNAKLTIENSTFYNNGGTGIPFEAEIYIAGRFGGHRIWDWQTGESYDLFTKGTILTGNTFEDSRSGQNVFGTYLSGSDWYDFANTLVASGNRWYNPATSSAFRLPSNKLVTFTAWKSAVGTDYSSHWVATASPAAACAVAAQ